ncbi:MAG: PTS sugar transporter subunit IIA [Propioniciclava sp.]
MTSADSPATAGVATATSQIDTVADWQAAIQQAGGLLVDLGVAQPRYVQACIDSVLERGPYIVLSKGVALAHARASEGAQALGVTLTRLDHPVSFGHPSNDPVDLVFAFCTPDDEGHVVMLRNLALSLGKGLADRLRAATDEAELSRLLTKAMTDES